MRIMSTLSDNLIHYALTHGIIYGIKQSALTNNLVPSTAVVHAPITMYPYEYPKRAFEDAVILAPIFNELINKVSRDTNWLRSVLTSTASNDKFTNQLLDILNIVEKQGIKQDLSLGLIRSDYMLHNVENDPRIILQVLTYIYVYNYNIYNMYTYMFAYFISTY